MSDKKPYTESRENMRSRLMGKIERGELHMRSRFTFVLRACAILVLVVLALFISIFLFNYLFFFLRINALEGHMRLLPFLNFFPWPLLVMDALLLFLAELLLRRFRFAYRRPMLLTLFVLFSFALSAGIAIDRSGRLNEQLESRANEHRLIHPLHELYFNVRHI